MNLSIKDANSTLLNDRYAELIIGDRHQSYDALEIQGVRDNHVGEATFINSYRCACGNEWSGTGSCARSDRCEKCKMQVEPHKSQDHTETECEVDNDSPMFFSVYVHLKEGGVECVGDFGRHHLGHQYAVELALKHKWPVHDYVNEEFKQLSAA